MRLFSLACAAVAALSAAPLAAAPINWTDWHTSSGNTGPVTVIGSMDVDGTAVTVTYTNTNSIAFTQLTGGIDYWQNGRSGRNDAISPYTSVGPNGVDNAPTGTDIIALRTAGTQTLTFSEAVSDIYFSFVSLNSNGYQFDRDFTLLSGGNMNIDGNGTDACGYWGCGSSSKLVNATDGTWDLIGTGEPHGTLLLDGTFTSVSWTSLSAENWNGFTVGAAGLAPVVPLPAGALLLASGLAVFGLRRRARG